MKRLNIFKEDLNLKYGSEIKDFLLKAYNENLENGRYDIIDGVYALVMIKELANPVNIVYEAHKVYADLQVVLNGKDCNFVTTKGEAITEYDEAGDCTLYKSESGVAEILENGDCLILMAEDLHAPNYGEGEVKKVVVKYPLEYFN